MDKDQQAMYVQAKELLADEKWEQASQILEKLMDEVEDPHLARLTVFSLYQAQLYSRARIYIFEYLDALVSNYSDANMTIDILLQNELFIVARQIALKLPENWQKDLLHLVQLQEEKVQQSFQETIQMRLKEFYHLGDQSLFKQQERLQAAYKLPLSDFIIGAKFVLRDPFAHPLVKSSIVELLCKLRVSEEVTILWIDHQEYQIQLSKLVPLALNPIVLAGKEVIQKRLENNNPQHAKLVSQQFELQMMFLYPRIEAVVTNVTRWIDIIIARINGQNIAVTDTEKKWEDKLEQLITDLMEKH